MSYQRTASAINATWSGIADAESGIVEYEWSVGRGPLPKQQMQRFVATGTTTEGQCNGNNSGHTDIS